MDQKPDWIEERYQKKLEIGRRDLGKSDRGLHDYILRGISNLDRADLDYIFGVRNPSQILSEGEQIHDNITIEDFAITGPYDGGEIAIGQVASCNGKEMVGSLPRDYLQVNRFGEQIEHHPDVDREVTGHYLVRSKYWPSEVKKRNTHFNRDLDFFGKSEIEVEILKIRPEERDLEEALNSFYSAL